MLLCRLLNPKVRFVFSNHLEVNESSLQAARELKPSQTLWFSDICPDRGVFEEILEILKSKKASCRVYEHHISRNWLTAFTRSAPECCEVVFDTTMCSSMIIWKAWQSNFLELKKLGDLVFLVNDRDLWKNTDPRSSWMSRLHFVLDDDGFVERFLNNQTLESTYDESVVLNYHLQKENKRLDWLLKTIEIKQDLQGFKYGIIYGNGVGSELLHRALEQKGLEYAMLVNLNAKRVAIRSLGTFDCASYAMERGGGGHRCAAGFPIEFEMPKL